MTLPIITIVGSLGSDPELRYTSGGVAVASLSIAVNDRKLNRQTNEWEDGEPQWYRATCWREFAEHVAGSLTKGMRVVATGRLKQRSYQDREGQNRTSIELEVDEIGPSLRYATVQVTRTVATSGQGARSQAPAAEEPWSTPSSAQGGTQQWADPQPMYGDGEDVPF